MDPQKKNNLEAVEFDDIEFNETPTKIVVEAVREYEETRPTLRTEEGVAADSAWSFLAPQVVGHEVGQYPCLTPALAPSR